MKLNLRVNLMLRPLHDDGRERSGAWVGKEIRPQIDKYRYKNVLMLNTNYLIDGKRKSGTNCTKGIP
jgi:hypothetical protein